MLMGDLFPTRSQARDLWVFIVQIWVTNWVKSERYRVIETHTCASSAPDEVPYPIEPTRYVLGRDTTAFQIRTHEPDVEIT